MPLSEPVQCSFCGSSRFIDHKQKGLLECQFCGGLTAIKTDNYIPQDAYQVINGEIVKKDLLRRLRYFVEHGDLNRASRALSELKYQFPGDENVLFAEKVLGIKEASHQLQLNPGLLLKSPDSPLFYFDVLYRAKTNGNIDTNELEQLLRSICQRYSADASAKWASIYSKQAIIDKINPEIKEKYPLYYSVLIRSLFLIIDKEREALQKQKDHLKENTQKKIEASKQEEESRIDSIKSNWEKSVKQYAPHKKLEGIGIVGLPCVFFASLLLLGVSATLFVVALAVVFILFVAWIIGLAYLSRKGLKSAIADIKAEKHQQRKELKEEHNLILHDINSKVKLLDQQIQQFQ